MDVFLAVPGRADALRAHCRRLRPAYVVDKRGTRAAAGMGIARGAVPWKRIYRWTPCQEMEI